MRNVVRATGEERWLLHKCSALRDADGEILRVVNVIENVTEVKRAERAQRLLADASEALAASLDHVEQLGALAHVLVAGAGAPRPRVELPRRAREPAARDRGRARRRARRRRTPAAMIRAAAGGRGAARQALARARRPLRRLDAELAAEIGRRAGVAVLNARMLRGRTAIARALQHGLLPPELPDVPGWSAAVLYRPAGEFNEVGGDFYDVFEGPKGWMVVIGDVAGQGAEAASATSLARFTVRTAAELTGDVSARRRPAQRHAARPAGLPLCTVVCAELRRARGRRRGRDDGQRRPPAAAARARAARSRRSATPARSRAPSTASAGRRRRSMLEPGDVLVLYTDGVLDAMGEDDRFGERRLRDALGAARRARPGARWPRCARELEAFERGPQRDDTTVLMLEYRGGRRSAGRAPAAAPPRR